MHIKVAFFLLGVVVAGCTRATPELSFHVSIQNTESRQEISQLYDGIHAYNPIMIYDEESGILNVHLLNGRDREGVSQALREVDLDLLEGLSSPSPRFLEQIECRRSERCETPGNALCSFSASVSRQDHRLIFSNFSSAIVRSAYPVLGVFYREDGEDILLSVPFYDQCESAARELSQMWENIASSPIEFRRSE